MRFVFGDCELDTERYELRRAGHVVTLEPKAFRVLASLVQQPGRAVAKRDLLEACWPGMAADSYKEYSLRNCLNKIRQAVGDAGTQHPVIETVRSYGYRFAAEVTTLAPGPGASGAAPQGQERDSHPPAASAPPPLPGWRQVTVLRCELAENAFLARLDHEDFRTIVQAFYTACERVIQHFAGYIAQYDSHGLLVYFGYPSAYEDAAQRAVRTGLGLVEAVQQLVLPGDWGHRTRLAVCVGIHTGQIVVEEQRRPASRALATSGRTLTIARRVQEHAGPDTIVISTNTYELVHGYFTSQALEESLTLGADQRLALFRILGESGRHTRLEVATTRGLTPFVGREPEVALLLHRWEQARDGMGHVVVLSGEPGIGKSRLVQALQEHIADSSSTYLECRGSPYYQNTALYPITDLLHRMLDWQRDDTADEKLQKLVAALAPGALAHDETIPLFAGLLSLPLPPERYTSLTLSPQQQKQKTLATLVEWLVQMGERHHPVLAVWEDLHWTDPTTLELLSLLIEQVPTARLLVLLTCRPEFRPPWSPRSSLTQLTLSRLSRPESEALLGQVVHGKAFPPEVRAHVVARTDGVPLFVEELLRTILDSDLIREDEERYVLTGVLPATAIPTTLQDALLARLDRLPEARDVAQLAATLGRDFTYEVLQAVVGLDAPVLQQRLAQLVDAEIVYQRGLPPHARYRFKHALIQDAAYQALLKSTQQQYHQRIAQVLEAQFPGVAATQPELLAQHYTAAGLHEQAIPYWQRAAQHAEARSAYREAVTCFERALQVLQHLPQNHTTLEQAVDLRLAVRSALTPIGSHERSLSYLREAESFAETLGDPRRLAEISVLLSRYFSFTGAHKQAIAAAKRTLTLATARGDIILHARANYRLGMAHQLHGDYRRAIDCYKQAVAFFDGSQRRERFGQIVLPAVTSRVWLAWCYADLGVFTEGKALGDEGLRIAEAVEHPATLLVASWGSGLLALRQGDLPRALPRLERAMGIYQESDLTTFFPRIAAALGTAYALAGRVAAAVALFAKQTMEQTLATEMAEFQALYNLSLGEAHLLAGHLEVAHALAERTLAFTRAHQERGNEAYALHLLGEIMARCPPLESAVAEGHYQHALALAVELGMRPLVAHCHLSLGTLYLKGGRWNQAHTALSTALALYRAMEMLFWLPQAEAVLSQIKT